MTANAKALALAAADETQAAYGAACEACDGSPASLRKCRKLFKANEAAWAVYDTFYYAAFNTAFDANAAA